MTESRRESDKRIDDLMDRMEGHSETFKQSREEINNLMSRMKMLETMTGKMFDIVDETKTTLIEMSVKVVSLCKKMEGNGQKGVIDRFVMMEGAFGAVKWVAGGSGLIGLAMLVIKILEVVGK